MIISCFLFSYNILMAKSAILMLMHIQLPSFDSIVRKIFERCWNFSKEITKIIYSVITLSLHAAIDNNGKREQYPSAL